MKTIKQRNESCVRQNHNEFICYYRNSNYDLKVKKFETMDDGLAFTRLLDKRIEKGTCYGYEFSRI